MDRKTKIMWLIKGLGVGGAEQLLANSVPHLDTSRFSYEVAYFLPWKTSLVDHFESHGIPVFCLNAGNPLDLGVVFRLKRLLQERKVDVLDSHLPVSGFIGRVAGRLAKTPAIMYTEHSLSVQRRIENIRYAGFLSNIATYPMADLILAVSQDTYDDVKRFKVGKTPLRLVYNGIDLYGVEKGTTDGMQARRALGIPDDHRVVGHVANMVSKKRQIDILRAAKMVTEQFPKVTFVLVGRGPDLEKLRDIAQSMGLGDNVVLPGFVDDLWDTMSCFDVFVLSSLHEGLPTVIIESLAMGIPAVATRVGGTPEIITDGQDGFLTTPKAPEEIAEKVLMLLQDDGLRSRMSQAGRETARRKFDIKRRVKEVEEIYSQLTSHRVPSLVAG